ncbi:MAG: prepilin-type N-terminal cleavage/methylation domain-containing protein [Rickettsiales bacterium]|jgi:prepilin-type N-terminal cleavage/methylation domain-containing protein|nr:prepilin-type N-terminal cleavage/methylation domain-containing protein [Rickettsiales bacterium]
MNIRKQNSQGFSLVELSIVIIILGLLVASVTVGKDLIKAAQVRGVITQLTQFNTSSSTFNLKYDCLPGDCAKASRRGLGSNNGNGNGIYEDSDYDTDSLPDLEDNEIVYFWEHLYLAGFTNGAFDGDSTNGVIGETFPKLKSGGGLGIYGLDGINYYHLCLNDSVNGAAQFEDCFVPEDAFAIDNKYDDGFPLKGSVIARSSSCGSDPNAFSCANTPITTTSGGASITASEACVYQAEATADADDDEYDFENTSASCNLRIRMQ